MAHHDWKRVGRYVVDRMGDINIDQHELVTLSTLSQPTVASFMNGEPRADTPRTKTLRSLESGLGWTRGSVADILAGGEPTVAAHPTGHDVAPTVDDLAERLARVEHDLESLGAMLERMVRVWSAEREAFASVAGRLVGDRDTPRSDSTM